MKKNGINTTNTAHGYNTSLGLPDAPLWLGIKEENLAGQDIIIILNTKEEAKANLVSINSSAKQVIIQKDNSNDKSNISFNEFSYFIFLKKFQFNSNNVPVVFSKPGVELPNWDEPYSIQLKTGEILKGNMKACIIDDSGVHLFKIEENHITRYFIPEKSIDHSSFGNKTGDELLSRNVVKAKNISKALHDQNIYKAKKIGEFLLDHNMITQENLDRVLGIQKSYKRKNIINVKIGDLLIEESILTKRQLENALKLQKQKRNEKIGDILIKKGYASELEVNKTLSNRLTIPLILIDKFEVNTEALKLVPFEIAKKYLAFPLDFVNDHLLVTFNDPLNKEAVDAVKKASRKTIETAISPKKDIKASLLSYYGSSVIESNFEELEIFHLDTFSELYDQDISTDKYCLLSDAIPVVTIIDNIFHDAIQKGASAIHIKPEEYSVDLIYRIHNKLVKQHAFHKGLLSLIIARLKILGKMNISECGQAQTGLASVDNGKNKMDLLISILPTITGESAVIRLKYLSFNLSSLQNIGLSDTDLQKMLGSIQSDFGMVLVVGPRASGKTTTLYAALRELGNKNLSVITLETPIEKHISSAEQINAYSFSNNATANLLHGILNHDPDVIMLGEIFDTAMAKIAFEDASSRHLVLSSMDTNNFRETLKRLFEMGVNLENLGKNPVTILIQRLARKNCSNCLELEDVEPDIARYMNVDESEKFYQSLGCGACNGSGFDGKILIYELIQFSEYFKKIIRENLFSDEDYQKMLKDSVSNLSNNALEKARLKIISLKEAYELTSERQH